MSNIEILYNAASYLGHREIKGAASDPVILDAVHVLFPGWRDDSTIAWCSCFMHLVAQNLCLENPADAGHPNPGLARSWLTIGAEVTTPLPGDVAILWRGSPSSSKGHVGIFCNQIGSNIFLIGGNQSDAITLSRYSKNRLITYRRISKI